MNIHEHQAKEILRRFGVPVPRGMVAHTPEEAEAAARELASDVTVVKAQIHAGGRGKAGGVKLASSPAETKRHTATMLGSVLVTPQTGPEGRMVRKVYIEEGSAIAKEYYLGFVVDRAESRVVIMASREGGVEIEEIAAHSPEKILRASVDVATGIQPFHARKLAAGLGLHG
jgi:succinyl-CoA synthetase beta subunit